MNRRETPGPRMSLRQQLGTLRSEEAMLSQKMKKFPLTASDQSDFAALSNQLENIRNLIAQLTESIPSAGPSPVTQDYRATADPQGRRPWRGKRG